MRRPSPIGPVTESAPERQWRLASLSALTEGILVEADDARVIVEPGQQPTPGMRPTSGLLPIRRSTMRFARSTTSPHGSRELPCPVRSGSCRSGLNCFSGRRHVKGWDDPRIRVPVEVISGGLKPFVALAVLAGHGVAVWRFPGGDGIGLSIPIAPNEG